MATAWREQAIVKEGFPAEAKDALKEFAALAWKLPEVRYVYGYFDDGWLVAVTVGSFVPLEDRHLVYAAQWEIERRHPEFDWGFRFIDEGGIPHTVPYFEPGEMILLERSNAN